MKTRSRVRSKRPRVRKAVGRLGLPGDANELIWTKEKPDSPDSRDRKVSLSVVAQLNSARLKNTAELHYTKLRYRRTTKKSRAEKKRRECRRTAHGQQHSSWVRAHVKISLFPLQRQQRKKKRRPTNNDTPTDPKPLQQRPPPDKPAEVPADPAAFPPSLPVPRCRTRRRRHPWRRSSCRPAARRTEAWRPTPSCPVIRGSCSRARYRCRRRRRCAWRAGWARSRRLRGPAWRSWRGQSCWCCCHRSCCPPAWMR